MAKNVKKRSEIEDKYKWDLESMFKNDDAWKNEYEKLSKDAKLIVNYQGKILESPKTLLEFIEYSLDMLNRLTDVYVYAHMRCDEDTGNTFYQNLKGQIDNLNAEIDKLSSFTTPEMLQTPYSKVKEYIKQEPKLKEYECYLEKIYRDQPHTLTKTEEQILSNLSKPLNSSSNVFYYLNNTDLKFGTIKDENGETVQLTHSSYGFYVKSKDREIRRNVMQKLHNTYSKFNNTLAAIYGNEVETNKEIALMRNFTKPLEYFLFPDDISKEIYDKFVKETNNSLKYNHKYLALKKEILGYDKLHMYDLYVNLAPSKEKKYTFEEGRDLVLKVLEPLGEEYINILKKAFNENWIDVYENENKKSGAYSWGTYTSKPFVLQNFMGNYHDVSTLAHELGHSIHSYFSNNNQPFQYHNYPIFSAEIASTVNEMLLNKYVLNNSKDKDFKLSIISEMLENFRTTIFRQMMFSEFENKVFDLAINNEAITAEKLNKLHYDLNKKYMGKSVTVDKFIQYEWSRIPHFYQNFYVYKYATGFAIACYITNRILNGDIEFRDKYINFLKSGCRDFPLNLLKECDIDVEKDNIIENSMTMYDELIEEFKKIYYS